MSQKTFVGKKVSSFTVIKKTGETDRGFGTYLIRCECGLELERSEKTLRYPFNVRCPKCCQISSLADIEECGSQYHFSNQWLRSRI